MSIFACEQSFRSRQPLPQFLPSSHPLLNELIAEKEVNLGLEEHLDPHELSFSIISALAENEMLEGFVGSIENLLDICRALFGTTSWMPDHTALDRHTSRMSGDWDGPSSPESGSTRSPGPSFRHLYGLNSSNPPTPRQEFAQIYATSPPPTPRTSRGGGMQLHFG